MARSTEIKEHTKRMLSARLRSLLAIKGMTQSELAAASGVSNGQIREIKAGRSDSTLVTVTRLSAGAWHGRQRVCCRA